MYSRNIGVGVAMNVSKKCDYACRAVLDLCMDGNGVDVVSVADISRRQSIPLKYCEHILSILKKNNIVRSKRGNSGGYLLIKPPKEITLKEIVLAVDGSIKPIDCYGDNRISCQNFSLCPFQEVWMKLEKIQLELLEGLDFDTLVKRKREMVGNDHMYHI